MQACAGPTGHVWSSERISVGFAPPNAVSYMQISPDGSIVRGDAMRLQSRFPGIAETDRTIHGRLDASAGATLKPDIVIWAGDRYTGGGTFVSFGPLSLVPGSSSVPGGQIAFIAGGGAGWEENASLFVADRTGVRLVIKSKGRGFGSGDPGPGGGDPTPVGGTFCGIGSVSANKDGDLLFLADVRQGQRSRGLFLYRQTTGDVLKVAAVGETSPSGYPIQHIGESHLNDRGEVIFMALTGDSFEDAALFKWRDGDLSEVFLHGDAAPGRGTIGFVSSLMYGHRDGTWFPDGGDISGSGTVVCDLYVHDENATPKSWSIIATSKNGAERCLVTQGDHAPGGGSFTYVCQPLINGRDDIAFLAFTDAPSEGGWFARTGEQLRKILLWYDRIGDETVYGLGYHEAAIANNGDVLVWASTSTWEENLHRDHLIRVNGNKQEVLAATDTVIDGLGKIWLVANGGFATRNSQLIALSVCVYDESSQYGSKCGLCTVRSVEE